MEGGECERNSACFGKRAWRLMTSSEEFSDDQSSMKENAEPESRRLT